MEAKNSGGKIKRKRGGVGFWGGVFGVLVLAIIGLSVGIVLSKGRDIVDEQEDWMAKLGSELEAVGSENIDKIIEIYDRYFEHFKGEDLAKLYIERAMTVVRADYDKKYGQGVIKDLVSADEILKTADSAGTVYNYARYYGDLDVLNRYEKILEERRDSDVGSIG